MPRTLILLGMPLLALSILAPPRPASAKTLVDCNQKRFKNIASPKSLMGWSNMAERNAKLKFKEGVYPDSLCKQLISQRGSAHCQKPGNATIRTQLAAAIRLCKRATTPSPKSAPINCAEARFKKSKVGNSTLNSWAKMAIRSIKGLSLPREAFQLKSKCTMAVGYLGTVICRSPKDPEATKLLRVVRALCASVKKKLADDKASAIAAQKKAATDRKKNRKITRLPRSTWHGDKGALRKAMRVALLRAHIAKRSSDIRRIQPLGRWQRNFYRGTRKAYRKAIGVVLWADKDGDGICRYNAYKFISDKSRRGRWLPLRFRAYCMGCPEGWTRCKK